MSELQQAAQGQQSNNPVSFIYSHAKDIQNVLTKGTDMDRWLQMARLAVMRDQNLVASAKRDPGSLMQALLDCAEKGHVPGTEDYYLVPRKGGIQGMESWKGIAKRIMRSGRYQSIVNEVVYEGETFEFNPNTMDRPVHNINYMTRTSGKPVMSYAYALDHDGKPSSVAIADPRYIAKVKKNSRGSVWEDWDEQMYRKTAVKMLQDYVDTSSVDRRDVSTVQVDDANVIDVDDTFTALEAGE
ncbi:RecT-like DNA pairing protein [Gordonia phage Lozinak]|uniref:RecT-like DNA pairing protein n=4 Tax=Smoothievirus TaxID=1982557 RepID=A0A2D1GG21_9CAUD|nr:RecT-like ssDNA annealing protein [Gordonia phage Smoothie]YP_009273126.1 RecT-like ssDNA annealing protein [Gordonia phage ClubL]ATN90717.1 RecT-like DNA pairing protein [Gordonia phage Lozinak]AUE23598.1 RecT-like DNA pairing protein [Gordonia phage Toniann]QAU06955.1 RecT-like DNA pairing protein [Gordonia phage Aphelion]QYC53575.1 RecT-like DNA pairing protein [Gordonia phage Norvs]ANA86248.1 RecT-like DNA pairing protein [Gordonia phage Smoothie]